MNLEQSFGLVERDHDIGPGPGLIIISSLRPFVKERDFFLREGFNSIITKSVSMEWMDGARGRLQKIQDSCGDWIHAASSISMLTYPCSSRRCQHLLVSMVWVLRLVRMCSTHVCMLLCIPMSFKGRHHKSIQSNCKMFMLLLDQHFTLFRMVDLVFL